MSRTQVSPFATLALAAAIAVVMASPAYAQAIGATATVTGQVADATGAVIPGARLTLENLATQVVVETTSNELGYYRFSFLRPASFVLTAESVGFSIATVENITLLVNQTQNVNFSLQPSAVQEVVTVTAAGAVLASQTSELGEVVSERPIRELPLLLRDPIFLVNLVPGVTADHRTPAAPALSNLSFHGRLGFTANGGMRNQATAMVDGMDITFTIASINSIPIVPTPDSTQEFQLMTNNYSAEYGRGSSSLNIVTKSGTNEFHGSVYWFLQNDNLNAQDLFLNRAGGKKAESKRHQAGFSLGGPIVKNKLWFFGDYEKLHDGTPRTISTRVPTSPELSGDFSDLFTTGGDPITIYNPLDTFTNAAGKIERRRFPNNRIPSSMINPFASKLGPYWGPGPNDPGLLGPNGERTNVNNLVVSGPKLQKWNRWGIKSDYQHSAKHKFMGRFSRSLLINPMVNVYGTVATDLFLSNRDGRQPGENAVVSWTWTASPTLMILQGVNYTWFRDLNRRIEGDFGFDLPSLGGPFNDQRLLSFLNSYTGGWAFPYINLSGYGNLGNRFDQILDEPAANFSYQLGVLKTQGSHTLKTGFHAHIRDVNQNQFVGDGGQWNFSGGFTNGPDPLLPSPNTGQGLATLLLGLPTGGDMKSGYTTATRSKYFALYVQDDWRVTNRFTLNLGLRWEIETPFTDRFDHFARFDPRVPNPLGERTGPNTNGKTLNQYFQDLKGKPLLGGLVWPSTPGYGRGIESADADNFAPRLGFAYRITDKLVMRGGFARIFAVSNVAATPSGVGVPENAAETRLVATIDGINPNATIDNPYPAGFVTPKFDADGLLGVVGHAMNAGIVNGPTRTPSQWQWNFGFQYEMPDQSIVELAYAGGRGRNLACGHFMCGDQVAEKDFMRLQDAVNGTVPNPFFGIITDPTSALSAPERQLGPLLRQWPQYNGVYIAQPTTQGPNGDTFKSAFESFQLSYRKTSAAGLTFQLAYTFSKNLTNADAFDGGYLGPTSGYYQDQVTFKGEKALSGEDVTHRLVVGHVYALPFGRGQRFGAGWPAALDKIAGGWEVSGIVNLSSGFPIPPGDSLNRTGGFPVSWGAGNRPNLVGNPCLASDRPRGDRIAQSFNESAFQHAEPFTFGNAPRVLNCRADGIKEYNFAAIKHIAITERFRVDFRAEFFNAFNRPQLNFPNATFGSGSFGRISSQRNFARKIQFGLKVIF